MPQNESGPGAVAATGPQKTVPAGSLNTFKNTHPGRPRQAHSARIVRLPIFRDGVWVGNDFLRIGPGLRARIRQMAAEAKR